MRKVILDLALTLDALIEGPNGEYDWCIVDEGIKFNEFIDSLDAIFYGRKSYEMFVAQPPNEQASKEEQEIIAAIKQKHSYVFSNTLKEVDGNATLVNGDIVQKVKELKSLPGKDIWLFGGASLTTTFVNEGLIDEYRLAVHPIILGAGKPLFQDIKQRVKLKLIKVNTYEKSGLVHLFYRPE